MSHGSGAGAKNRLASQSSPYLLLHASNPVDWFPWGEEAFAKARAEDRPIFLSVGYSTCYWCHVMEREVFSNEEIARQMNEGFINIKLDREERPDLDEIYMMATQILTRSGGWPNSLFLNHDLKPFFAGTYFPPDDWHGRPGFPRILRSVREAWAFRRAEIEAQSDVLTRAIREQLGVEGAPRDPEPTLDETLQRSLSRRFDAAFGGFGAAPKFPSPSNLFFLLDRARDGDVEARGMLVTTLDRMGRGGICDQIAGGFHRYSTDAEWLVPHFEKMLYDNAALATLFAEAHGLASEEGFDDVARRTLDFVLTDMRSTEGAFLSAIDAETHGHEGAYYVWAREELREALGEDDAFAASVLGFDGPPNFEQDAFVLHLPRPLRERAKELGIGEDVVRARLAAVRLRLLSRRKERDAPLVDDKIMTDWNGMMIGACARAGRVLGEPRFIDAARKAAAFLLERLRSGGRLQHTYRLGVARVDAMLDDYAFAIEGLLEVHAATGDAAYKDVAVALQSEQDEVLWDEEGGGYFAAGANPQILVRAKPSTDGAVASGNGVAVINLARLAAVTGQASFLDRARQTLRTFGAAMERMPLAYVTLIRGVRDVRQAAGEASGSPGPSFETELDATALAVVEARARFDKGGAGEWRPFALDLMIRSGWHVNTEAPAQAFLVPTRVEGDVRDLVYPEAESLAPSFSPEPIAVWSGYVTISGTARTAPGGESVLRLTYQACDESRCLAPVTKDITIR